MGRVAVKRKAKVSYRQKQPIVKEIELLEFDALTRSQSLVADNFEPYEVISTRGMPGTGKTFWCMYQAFKLILDRSNYFDRMLIIRSTVATRDMGHLPGTDAEKIDPYKAPYIAHCTKLFGRSDAFGILEKKGLISFESTAFLRGTEWNNVIVIVDEPQNMSDNELHTINTRFGEDCKLVFCGDTGQDDLTSKRYNEQSGYQRMNRIHDSIPDTCFSVTYTEEDIVRSGYIKDYIVAREKVS